MSRGRRRRRRRIVTAYFRISSVRNNRIFLRLQHVKCERSSSRSAQGRDYSKDAAATAACNATSTGRRHCCCVLWFCGGLEWLDGRQVWNRRRSDDQHKMCSSLLLAPWPCPWRIPPQRGKDGVALRTHSQYCGHLQSLASTQYSNN